MCGSAACARTDQDDDHDGVADAVAVLSDVADRRVVAVTGMPFAWVSPTFAAVAALLLRVPVFAFGVSSSRHRAPRPFKKARAGP